MSDQLHFTGSGGVVAPVPSIGNPVGIQIAHWWRSKARERELRAKEAEVRIAEAIAAHHPELLAFASAWHAVLQREIGELTGHDAEWEAVMYAAELQ